MKLKVKAKDCQLTVKVKLSLGETVDERELDRFSRVYLRGFLHPKMIKKNIVEYTGPVGISLYDRLGKPVSKRDFLFIIEQIVVAVQKLYANKFPLNNFMMDIKNVFINETTKEMQFLYVPVSNVKKEMNLISFIESIVYSVKHVDGKDDEFVSRFVYFFRALSPFDINKIESFVAKEDRSVVNTIKKQNAGQSGFMTSSHQHYYEYYDNNSNDEETATGILDEDDDATGILDEEDDATGILDEEDDATGILNADFNAVNDFAEDEATGLLSEKKYYESNSYAVNTAYQGPDSDSGDTALLVSDNSNDTVLLNEQSSILPFPKLYRVLTSETINVNKPVFRLGKEKSHVDYFVTNNTAVSRSHADIITRSNGYYVNDLNSKNHTYINDMAIPSLCETQIYDGDSLRLGNEVFIFKIEI